MKHKADFQLERHGARAVYRLTWAEVRRILGRDHANTAADDATLARALRAAGARPLGKSYAKEDGWHAFAPTGTKAPALRTKANPPEVDWSTEIGLDQMVKMQRELVTLVKMAAQTLKMPHGHPASVELSQAEFDLADARDPRKRLLLMARTMYASGKVLVNMERRTRRTPVLAVVERDRLKRERIESAPPLTPRERERLWVGLPLDDAPKVETSRPKARKRAKPSR